jgi:hypothetical protein
MFRATLCTSSGESIYQYNICYMSLCVGDRPVCRSGKTLHTGRSPTQSDIYQILYWHNWLSWWWAQGCSKHVENWNKYIKKELCVKLVIYWNYTEMHGHHNIKSNQQRFYLFQQSPKRKLKTLPLAPRSYLTTATLTSSWTDWSRMVTFPLTRTCVTVRTSGDPNWTLFGRW